MYSELLFIYVIQDRQNQKASFTLFYLENVLFRSGWILMTLRIYLIKILS